MLRTLSISNFRNLKIKKIDIKPGTVVIVGDNGQGKTNLLEAIYFLSYGKSFRGTKTPAINWHHNEARIVGEVGPDKIAFSIRREKENEVLINGKKKRIASLIGRFVSVLFHPEEIEIISGPPALRRAWFDKVASTTDKGYLYNLVRYQKALINKNRLLKTPSSEEELIAIWNKNLAALGTIIWKKRLELAGEINTTLKRESKKLIGKSLIFDYTNPVGEANREFSEKLYLKTLEAQRDLEKRLQATVFGPHRDDFKIVKEEIKEKAILKKELADFGSRAEQRQAMLLLKIVESEIYSSYFEQAPSILLDDVASELDKKNRELFLSRLWSQQVFITTTSLDTLPNAIRDKSQIVKMENGTPVTT
jgi:DNA replication and repair protein RecF